MASTASKDKETLNSGLIDHYSPFLPANGVVPLGYDETRTTLRKNYRQMNTLHVILPVLRRLGSRFARCSAVLVLTACASQPGMTMKTLDGNPPLIIGHRGLPGLYP